MEGPEGDVRHDVAAPNRLCAGRESERVNHSKNYSDHGKHINWVKSYFSRLRRMVTGQHHHVSLQHLHQYARLEDNRRNSHGENAADVLGKAMAQGVSRVWKGYWQRANA